MRPTSPIEATGPGGVAGRCLCGAFAFTHAAPVGAITACHCTQCRQLSGHYAASSDADEGRLAWTATGGLGTWAGPAGSTRGFCRT
ncbi:GFA family protein [Wenxinia marina]|uniref:CENP-V/GFA domain-containing protein n=1 Tax=Wenxinia marina DSM 24838 TaxID=1123501 RepID=A0A0D0QH58_9RHOB|nr:hypothetical protein [Wenxinia marina]KIQ70393.1 hypothetical protein Wenmar_00769 [Wenxinia marina DSM 24838]GGL53533.1 hypothetical protein GCM10011392_04840 [Wenxinia marina]